MSQRLCATRQRREVAHRELSQSQIELIGEGTMLSKIRLERALSIVAAGSFLMLGMSGIARAISPVPELDPGTAGSGLAILVAGVLLFLETHRRRR